MAAKTEERETAEQHPVTNRSIPVIEEDADISVTPRDLATLIEIDVSRLDPAFKYRLVYKNQLRVARAKSRGYVVVDPLVTEVFTMGGEQLEPDADGTYTIGDTLFMKISKRGHRVRRKDQKRRTDQRLSAPRKKFKSTAQSKRDRAGQPIEVITSKEPGGSGRRR